jgi:UDP-glucuronate decarboxylase
MDPADGRVVSNFICQALLGRPITLYGEGTQTRSFCYVDDLIDGLIRLMHSSDAVTGPVNIGNPGEFTIRELAGTVLELTGSRSPLLFQPLPADDPRQRRPDIAQARVTLGWEPQVRLREGLKQTIAWFDGLLAGEDGARLMQGITVTPGLRGDLMPPPALQFPA